MKLVLVDWKVQVSYSVFMSIQTLKDETQPATSEHKVPFYYTRISNDPLGLEAGVARQRQDSLAVIEKQGWNVAEALLFEDNDVSAYKRVKRPAFEAMLASLDKAHCLVAYDLDRLMRQPRDLERLIDRCEEVGLSRVITASGELNLLDHEKQLHARIMVAVAKKASDDTSRR